MRRFVIAAFVAGAFAVVHVQPVLAGASTDAALGLGAFAVLNQIVRGETIFGGAVVQPRPVIVQPQPVIVVPPPPAYVVPAPPPAYVAPAPPVVYAPPAPVYVIPEPRPVYVVPRGEWVWRGGHRVFVAHRGHDWSSREHRHDH
jgi:hypothetical protein